MTKSLEQLLTKLVIYHVEYRTARTLEYPKIIVDNARKMYKDVLKTLAKEHSISGEKYLNSVAGKEHLQKLASVQERREAITEQCNTCQHAGVEECLIKGNEMFKQMCGDYKYCGVPSFWERVQYCIDRCMTCQSSYLEGTEEVLKCRDGKDYFVMKCSSLKVKEG